MSTDKKTENIKEQILAQREASRERNHNNLMLPNRMLFVLLFSVCLCVNLWIRTSPAAAQSQKIGEVTTPPIGSRERTAILEAVRTAFKRRSGQTTQFMVRVLRVYDTWAFAETQPASRAGHHFTTFTVVLRRSYRRGYWTVERSYYGGSRQEIENDIQRRYPDIAESLLSH